MGKALKFTLLLLAVLPSAGAGEAPRRYYEVAVSSRPARPQAKPSVQPPAAQPAAEKRKASPAREKGLFAAVEEIDAPDRRKKKKNTIETYKGADAVKWSRTVTIPKNGNWRIMWLVDIPEGETKGDFHIRVDFPLNKGFQELSKTMLPVDDGAYGVINICDTEGGDFSLIVDASKVKWSLDIQLVE